MGWGWKNWYSADASALLCWRAVCCGWLVVLQVDLTLVLVSADAPRWEPQLVENVPEPAFHHRLVGERYLGAGATREAILHPLRSLGELGQTPDEEGQSPPQQSVVKGYENTIIEMKPLKEAETAVDRFTRRWHVMLFSKVKTSSKWLDQVEELIYQKEDLKTKVTNEDILCRFLALSVECLVCIVGLSIVHTV